MTGGHAALPCGILLPVYFRGEEEQTWSCDEGKEVLSTFFQRVHGAYGAVPISVVSEKDWVLALAEECSLSPVRLRAAGSKEEIFPRGTFAACEELGCGDGSLAVMDFRAPFTTQEAMESAIQELGSGVPVAVSARVPRDHPCQFRKAFNLTDIGCIYFPDSRYQERHELIGDSNAWTVSRRFPHDWRGLQVQSGSLYSRQARLGAPDFVLARTEDALLWVADGPQEARVAYRNVPGALPEKERACTWTTGNDSCFPVVSVGRSADSLAINICGDCQGDIFLLRVVPFGESVELDSFTLWFLPGDEGVREMSWNWPAAAGFAYHLYSSSPDGTGELEMHISPEDAPWVRDDGGRVVSVDSGEAITGRQGFPSVLKVVGNLSVFQAGFDFSTADEAMLLDKPKLFEVSSEASLRVEDWTGLLRAVARLNIQGKG